MSQLPEGPSTGISPAAMKPLIFSMPDFTPDTRLRVFGQDFHVHSSFLKLHSAFFRTFLDSPEKGLPATSCGFRYEWVTEVDKDDTWSLVWAGSTEKSGTVSDVGKFTGDQNAEISAFTIVIQAIYNWRFIIRSPAQLCVATKMADYHCTLPSLSKSLYVAFGRSREFCDSPLPGMYDIADGPVEQPKYLMIKDKKLKQLAALAHHSICRQVLSTQQHLSQEIVKLDPEYTMIYQKQELGIMVANISGNSGEVPSIRLPSLYRQLVDGALGNELEGLLQNNLALYPAAIGLISISFTDKPGDWNTWCDDYFLCLEIEDDELPWDVNEQDW
ncbi:hypothetical protein LSUB1_G000600 [Lachnellula subtilissima]|uniref:BTB domain-containing protein n=1 Tax=Lachnellula subtilissima TaxID=602034 RepID=A0A8H8S193_9HELO|nr:hypothetical protein LSUB1_G000600 [Lachnellula subtilissima]